MVLSSHVENQQKQRTLTPAETRRQERYEQISEQLTKQGYVRHELIVSIVKANIFGAVLFVGVAAVLGYAFFAIHSWDPLESIGVASMVIVLAVTLALIVVHELLHGLTWSFFTQNRFKDIEFGFIKENLTPYCTCTVPLPKGGYILGALMPLIVLGVVPAIISITTGSFLMLFIGILMIGAAAGDILIVVKLLAHKNTSPDVRYFDHPTDAGVVVFERAS